MTRACHCSYHGGRVWRWSGLLVQSATGTFFRVGSDNECANLIARCGQNLACSREIYIHTCPSLKRRRTRLDGALRGYRRVVLHNLETRIATCTCVTAMDCEQESTRHTEIRRLCFRTQRSSRALVFPMFVNLEYARSAEAHIPCWPSMRLAMGDKLGSQGRSSPVEE